jgi:phenylpropionate dioxygenase-like ring-hydroxylating dioxygenase large terminal subunit
MFKDCDIDSADINKLNLEFCGDFIFVGINPKTSLTSQLSDLKHILEDISFNISTRLDFDSCSFECVFPIAIENALESEHVAIVHKDTLASLKLQKGDYKFFGDNSVWTTTIGNEKIDNGLKKISKNFNIVSQHQGYQNILIYPFAMLSSTYGYSYSLQNFFPGGDNITNFNSRYYPSHVNEGSNSFIEFFFKEGVKMNKKIFKEDADICACVPQESWSIEMPKYSRDIDDRLRVYRSTLKLI